MFEQIERNDPVPRSTVQHFPGVFDVLFFRVQDFRVLGFRV